MIISSSIKYPRDRIMCYVRIYYDSPTPIRYPIYRMDSAGSHYKDQTNLSHFLSLCKCGGISGCWL